jgi:hypothetical protein
VKNPEQADRSAEFREFGGADFAGIWVQGASFLAKSDRGIPPNRKL